MDKDVHKVVNSSLINPYIEVISVKISESNSMASVSIDSCFNKVIPNTIDALTRLEALLRLKGSCYIDDEAKIPELIDLCLDLAKKGLAENLLNKLIENHNYNFIEVLLKNGLSPHYGNAQLMRCALYYLNYRLYLLVIKYGFDIETENLWLVWYVHTYCNIEKVKLLIKFHIEDNRISNCNNYLIHDDEFITKLFKMGLDAKQFHLDYIEKEFIIASETAIQFVQRLLLAMSLNEIKKLCWGDSTYLQKLSIITKAFKINLDDYRYAMKIFNTFRYFHFYQRLDESSLSEIAGYYIYSCLKQPIMGGRPPVIKHNKAIMIVNDATANVLYITLNFPILNRKIDVNKKDIAYILTSDNLQLFKIIERYAVTTTWLSPTRYYYALSAAYGAEKIIKYLLTHKKKLQSVIHTTLYFALHYGQIPIIKSLLKKYQTQIPTFLRNKILQEMLNLNKITFLKVLLKRVHLNNYEICRLFQKASYQGNIVLARELYSTVRKLHLFEICFNYDDLLSSLLHFKEVKILLDVFARIKEYDYILYATYTFNMLEDAIKHGQPEKLRVLVKMLHMGNDIEDRQKFMQFLMNKVSGSCTVGVAKFLIKCGIDYKHNDNQFILDVCWQENFKVLDYLIKKVVNLKDDGEVMLEFSLVNKCYFEADWLLLKGVQGVVALCKLYNRHRFEEAEYLIKKGVHIDKALLEACNNNYYLACKHLLRNGAIIPRNDINLLSLAANNNHLSISKLLVEYGAEITFEVMLAACTNTEDDIRIIQYFINISSEKFLLNPVLINSALNIGNINSFNYLNKFNLQQLRH